MKIFLKIPMYVEISCPDGTDRKILTRVTDDRIKPALRSILDQIKIDPEDLIGIPGIPGETLFARFVDQETVHRSQLIKQKVPLGLDNPDAV